MGAGRGKGRRVQATVTLMAGTPLLSAAEREQLGSQRLRRDGTPSAHPWPSAKLWSGIRQYMLGRSKASNPLLDPELVAYTPGETLQLLQHPEVKEWHQAATARLPERYKTIVLVPCAKTKPWVGPAVRKSKLYSAYNALREELPDVAFVTISEPLGIVPMDRWGDFPQYDNPGLFSDDVQRSGMTTKEWLASPFKQCYAVPFDPAAKEGCIATLGGVVGDFLSNHSDRKIISVVDNAAGPASTHDEMLTLAIAQSGANVERHPKRLEPHVSPLGYLRQVIS